MRLAIVEDAEHRGPSSPFARSAFIRDGDALCGLETITALRAWCVERWGESVSMSDARTGYFPTTVKWFSAGDRFWFGHERHFFEFRMRWHGASASPAPD